MSCLLQREERGLTAQAESSMDVERDTLVLYNDEDKKCAKCGKNKPLYHFNRSRSSADTYQSYCKECQHKYNAERRLKREIRKLNYLSMSLLDIVETSGRLSYSEKVDLVRLLNNVIKDIGLKKRTRKSPMKKSKKLAH